MIGKLGLARMSVIIPMTVRDTGETVLVPTLCSLVIEPIDPSTPGRQMNEKTIREAITEDLFGFEEFYVSTFLKVVCDEYKGRSARLAFLFGYNYKGKTYPCEMIFEYRGDRLKRRIVSAAVAEESKGWTVEVRVNSKKSIWLEDIIDGITEILNTSKESKVTDREIANNIIKFASSIPGIDWYSATIIHGTFFAQSERKVKSRV